MNRVESWLLSIVAVIHLLPMAGVLGAARLHRLYGVPLGDPNLVLLMQHRAVLFGLLGVFLLAAALRPALAPMGLAAGLVSVVSFLGLALGARPLNEALTRVVAADVVALVCLVAAVAVRAAR